MATEPSSDSSTNARAAAADPPVQINGTTVPANSPPAITGTTADGKTTFSQELFRVGDVSITRDQVMGGDQFADKVVLNTGPGKDNVTVDQRADGPGVDPAPAASQEQGGGAACDGPVRPPVREPGVDGGAAGEMRDVVVDLDTGSLGGGEIVVQLLHGPLLADGSFDESLLNVVPMAAGDDGRFHAAFAPDRAGRWGVAARALPTHPYLRNLFDTGLVTIG